MKRSRILSVVLPILLGASLPPLACRYGFTEPHRKPPSGLPHPRSAEARVLGPKFASKLTAAALERTRRRVRYDGSYVKIPYPMGDVPDSVGVCTDVVVRSYRALGVDLQKEIHEDMARAFGKYPKRWGLRMPDPNIDHRRVLNMEVFFARRGLEVASTDDPRDYLPGDLVTWTVGGSRPHIGIVTAAKSEDGARPLIVHNIGWGPRLEDMLFEFPITGHFRYAGPTRSPSRISQDARGSR